MATLGRPHAAVLAGDGRRHPTVTIVSVNYNGCRYLERFLTSLREIDYPSECQRVVIVDNGSTDESVVFVRTRFPEVLIVEAGRNLGFAGGCNLGIAAYPSDYVALVNNDTVVEPGWLRALVKVAESDPRVGLVGSKLLFLTPFLDVRLTVVSDSQAHAAQGPALELLEARTAGCDYEKLFVYHGRIHGGSDTAHAVYRLGRSARLAAPVAHVDAAASLILTLRAVSPGAHAIVSVAAGETEIGRIGVSPAATTVRLEVPRDTVAVAARDVINNAGTRIDANGRFGDRGIFELDGGQYDTIADMPALCGASMLLRRVMLERIGGFDTRFFMYFEDVDLSWRARRAGWRAVYTPESRLRHVHAGTSQEGSPAWVFFVTRNHLFWLIKHGDLWPTLREIGALAVRAGRAGLRAARRPRSAASRIAGAVDIQVARSVLRHLPGLLISRYARRQPGRPSRWTTVKHPSPSQPDEPHPHASR